MSKDIRSFFTVLSKKSSSTKKPAIPLADSDDEVIESTPEPPKGQRKRKGQILSSDSEDDAKKPSKPSKEKTAKKDSKVKEEKPKLKPIDLDSINVPIQQSKVEYVGDDDDDWTLTSLVNKGQKKKESSKKKKPVESGVHKDKHFAKTLEDLDQDSDDTILLENLDILDKTLEEALKTENQGSTQANTEIKPKDNKAVKMSQATPKKAEKRARKNSQSTPKSTKKPKLEETDSGFDADLEKWSKKRQSTDMYMAYLHRGGPKNHGQKDYPKGNPDCLKGLTFLRTGVLDSLEGDEFGALVTDHGGRVVHSVSKKVDYLVVGDEPGPAKLEKARKYNIPEITEDQFLDLILTKSGQKPKYVSRTVSEDLGIDSSSMHDMSPDLSETDQKEPIKAQTDGFQSKTEQKNEIKKTSPKKSSKNHTPVKSEPSESNKEVTTIKKEELEKTTTNQSSSKDSAPKVNDVPADNLTWTEKYKPTNMKAVIGQQDANSNMNKLKRWLQNWFKNANPEVRKKIPKPTQYNQMDGAYFKAALLSGPPGVGKTTTATLVAKELGFDIVEFNASDTRNKKLLHDEISNMMKSKTLAGFKTGDGLRQKRVLLMDEVDGMAGNEDRGGIAELINFIKTAQFPIICMCNNRDLPKMRSLVNYCFALKFGKPNLMQVRGAMMSICFKEGLKIQPEALSELITGTGCDIRQTLNHLSMWSAAEKSLSAATVKKESQNSQKDVVIGVWDMIRKVFNKSENKDMTLLDKARLFFYDYSFGPMFVQENYLNVTPECTGPSNKKSIEILLRKHLTADSLSRSDLIEARIRSSNNWSLLETQAYLSTVLPSYYLSGTLGQVRFPGWFGKNSQRNKCLRMTGEIYSHSRTTISGDKTSVRLDYAEPLTGKLLRPLIEKKADGVDETLEIMKSYSLLREDLTNLCELMTSFSNRDNNPFDKVASTVKAALTRKYNKVMVLSIAPPTVSKKKKTATNEEELFGEEDEISDEDNEEDNINNDGLIKVKSKDSAKAGPSKQSQKEKKPKGKTSKSDSKSKGKSK